MQLEQTTREASQDTNHTAWTNAPDLETTLTSVTTMLSTDATVTQSTATHDNSFKRHSAIFWMLMLLLSAIFTAREACLAMKRRLKGPHPAGLYDFTGIILRDLLQTKIFYFYILFMAISMTGLLIAASSTVF